MKKTAPQSAGVATNQAPPINHRPKPWYHKIHLYHLVVCGAYTVFICNMAISYFHAWELFSQVGYFPGKFAHVAVVAFDTVFALSNIVVSIGIMKKVKIGWQVWCCFLFGLFMTGWANVRASMGDEWILLVTGQWQKITVNGWESLISGLSTPTALVSIELLLFWMVTNRLLFNQKPAREEVREPEDETGRMKWEAQEITPAMAPAPGKEEAADTRADGVEDSPAPTTPPAWVEVAATREVETSSGKVENQVETSTPSIISTREEVASTLELENPVETPVGKEEAEVENTATIAQVENGGDGSAAATLESGVETSMVGQEETPAADQVEVEEQVEIRPSTPALEMEKGVEVEKREKGLETSTTLQEVEEQVEKKDALPSSSSSEEQEEKLEDGDSSTIVYSPGDDPLEVALKIMRVEGKRPGRPRLMKAGMSEHTAKMTAKKLEQREAS